MNKIKDILENWEKHLNDDEWYFSNQFDAMFEDLNEEEIYIYIDQCFLEITSTKNSYLIGQLIMYIWDLYTILNEKKVTTYYKNNKDRITKQIRKYGDEAAKQGYSLLRKNWLTL